MAAVWAEKGRGVEKAYKPSESKAPTELNQASLSEGCHIFLQAVVS